MPQLMKLVWGGALGKAESWSCSLHGLADDGAGPSVSNVAGIVKTFVQAVGSHHSGMAVLDTVKLNFVTAADKYVTPDNPVTFDVVPPGLGGAAPMPFQVALAVSTTTDSKRGFAHGGRWYIPIGYDAGAPALVDNTGELPLATAEAVALACGTFLFNLNAAGFAPQVYSVKGAIGRPITGVRVGRVYDTQRRRRRSLDESYVLGTISS